MNLYQVYVGDHEWCYFVFSTSRNRARSICELFAEKDNVSEDGGKQMRRNCEYYKTCGMEYYLRLHAVNVKRYGHGL